MLAHVLAVGNFESDENPKDGGGLNPNGGSHGIPVAKDKMLSSCNVKVVSFARTSPDLDSMIKKYTL